MRLQTGFSVWLLSHLFFFARNKALWFSCFAYDLPSPSKVVLQEFSLRVQGLIADPLQVNLIGCWSLEKLLWHLGCHFEIYAELHVLMPSICEKKSNSLKLGFFSEGSSG